MHDTCAVFIIISYHEFGEHHLGPYRDYTPPPPEMTTDKLIIVHQPSNQPTNQIQYHVLVITE
jgi:hypothetical protein